MTMRAFVQHDFAGFGVSVYLVQQLAEQRFAVGQPTEIVFEVVDADATTGHQQPTLRLPEEMARALLDALVAHFGGSSDVQTLRKDYVAERARVDKMIDHLIRT